MKVMYLDRITLKRLGIISSDEKFGQREVISRIVCLVIIPIVFSLSLISYLVYSFDDIAKATNAFYMICIVGMASTSYSEYWLKRSVWFSIMKQIQTMVDNSSIEFRPIYQKTVSFTYKIVYGWNVFAFCSVFGAISVPFCLIVLMWFTGNNPEDMQFLPAALKLANICVLKSEELFFNAKCTIFADFRWMLKNGRDTSLVISCATLLLISFH